MVTTDTRDMGPRTPLSWSEFHKRAHLAGSYPMDNHPLIDKQIRTAQEQDLTSVCLFPAGVTPGPCFTSAESESEAVRMVPNPSCSTEGWGGHRTAELANTVKILENIQRDFNNTASGGKKVSLADVIVLAGCAGIEQAAKNAGYNVEVPFTPGRMDALQEQTDGASFAVLEPLADGFRNYMKDNISMAAEAMLVDKAQLLTLTAPEMTVLIGGMRVLNTNFGQSKHGVFTKKPETLTNDFFINLLDVSIEWKGISDARDLFEGRDRSTGEVKWTGTRVDLIFGSNAQLRAVAEVYACSDAKEKFVHDFVAVWAKVMNLDRFDLAIS